MTVFSSAAGYREHDQDFLNGIVTKVSHGLSVTESDLEKLSEVLFSSCTSGGSSGNCNPRSLPYLDRHYLEHEHVEGLHGPVTMVRYVGMVQDMLDTEYYEANVNGKETHYRDFVDHEEGDSSDSLFHPGALAERTPLVVVPIPFCSDWFFNKLQHGEGKSISSENTARAEQDVTMDAIMEVSSKKRNREKDHGIAPAFQPSSKQRTNDDDDHLPQTIATESNTSITSMECDDPMTSTRKIANLVEDEGSEEGQSHLHVRTSSSSATDWWPKGCMGSRSDQVPVLAKLNYRKGSMGSKTNPQRKLRLNDLVEFVGIVSVDPMDANFSTQQSSSNQTTDISSLDQIFHYDEMIAHDTLTLPPPSQLPRVHVLCYNLLDLDQLTQSVLDDGHTSPIENNNKHTNNEDQECVTKTDSKSSLYESTSNEGVGPIQIMANALVENRAVSEATLLTLLSMAQRQLSSNVHQDASDDQFEDIQTPAWECVSTPTEQMTLGCASLNIQLPSESTSFQFYTQFQSLLKDILPVVATIDLTRNDLESNALLSPRKDSSGRLMPSPLQLPKGSTVLIHTGHMTEGTLSPRAHETLAAFQRLVESHVVPYKFDEHSMIHYPFEADFRVIVVSVASDMGAGNGAEKVPTTPYPRLPPQNSNKRTKLLPCALQVALELSKSSSKQICSTIPCSRREKLRRYLAGCRFAHSQSRGIVPNNVSLSRVVLELAQKEFMKRRVAARQSSSGTDCPAAAVEEQDLHRWLTLTRLQARGRNETTSEVVADARDWQRALLLDDAMAKSLG